MARRAEQRQTHRLVIGYEEVPSWGGAVKGEERFADRVLQAVGEPAVVPRGLTLERIARRVADEKGVDFRRLVSPSREREASRARFLTAWLARELGRIPVAQSARFFGRQASTMVNGLKRLDEARKTERGLQRTLMELREESSHRVYPDNDKRKD